MNGRHQAATASDGTLHVPHWTTDFSQPCVVDGGHWEASPSMRHWEGVRDDTENVLNSRVKHRQAFRPFALAERAREIFEGEEDCPFMLIAKRVRPEWRDRIPAVVHVDGTARVHTVREQTNPVLYRLLREFEALTGVPVLINTSFNVKGEPMVETPHDAVVCFLTTGIDHLILHDTLIAKSALHRIVGPLVGVYTDVATMVMASTGPA